MKTNLITVFLLGLIGGICFSCENLDIVADCDARVDFTVTIDPDCTSSCVAIFKNQSSGRFNSVLWTFGDGSPSSDDGGNEITHTYEENDTFNVVLTLFADGCESVEMTRQIAIGAPPPIPDFSVSMPRCTLVAEDCTFTFTDESRNSTSQEWFIDGVSQGSGTTLTKTYFEPDTVLVTLRASGPGGDDQISEEIIIRPLTIPLKTYDLDDDLVANEVVYGIDETATGEYYLIMNNGLETYLAKTDVFGTVTGTPTGHGFTGNPYNSLQPQGFTKTSSGYLLVGRAVKPDLNIDMFVFKATTTLSFFKNEALFRPFASDREDAFTAVETNINDNYLIGGTGAFDSGQSGMYLVELRPSLNQENTTLFSDFGTSGVIKAMTRHAGGYWIVGESNDSVFFIQLDNGLTMVGTPLDIQADNFAANTIIALEDTTAVILGNISNDAHAIAINVNGINQANKKWEEPHPGQLFRTGLLTSDGRIMAGGRVTSSALPALFEIDLDSGQLKGDGKDYEGTDIDDGDIFHLVETADGGFLMGGRGRKTGQSYHSILIKTDRNGDL